jgi:predicted ArsR family transcriptional regulator
MATISYVQQDIVNALRVGPLTVHELSTHVNIPEPSVRRNVQALRARGYDIRANSGPGRNGGGYKLFPVTTAPSQRLADDTTVNA